MSKHRCLYRVASRGPVKSEWSRACSPPSRPAGRRQSPLIPPHLSFFSLETRRDFSSRYFSTTALRVGGSGRGQDGTGSITCTPEVTELLCCVSGCEGQMWKLVDDEKKQQQKNRTGTRSEGGERKQQQMLGVELLRRRPRNSRTTLLRRLESYKSAKDTLQTAAVETCNYKSGGIYPLRQAKNHKAV